MWEKRGVKGATGEGSPGSDACLFAVCLTFRAFKTDYLLPIPFSRVRFLSLRHAFDSFRSMLFH
eukprot:4361254-Pleurochrysis_carterae.AAC.2